VLDPLFFALQVDYITRVAVLLGWVGSWLCETCDAEACMVGAEASFPVHTEVIERA
jgi:hypothetical protein